MDIYFLITTVLISIKLICDQTCFKTQPLKIVKQDFMELSLFAESQNAPCSQFSRKLQQMFDWHVT